jgi:folate-binding protein YgfZ
MASPIREPVTKRIGKDLSAIGASIGRLTLALQSQRRHISTMTESVYATHLNDRALIAVTGPGWREFLQGLLSQDVLTLKTGELRFAALLTPQGKLLFDLFLLGREDGCLIDVAADRRDALLQRLTLYRLRAKVEIGSAPGEVWAAWPRTDPIGPGWVPDPRLPALGQRGYDVQAPLGAETVERALYDRHRLSLGAPDPGQDCPPETTYPIEANFDLLGGIDFKKGCFVGQETTSRMKRRAEVRTRMVAITFDGPTPAFGTEVMAGDLRAGEVRSGAHGHAIALLRLDRIEGAPLTIEGRPAQFHRPAYFDGAVGKGVA